MRRSTIPRRPAKRDWRPPTNSASLRRTAPDSPRQPRQPPSDYSGRTNPSRLGTTYRAYSGPLTNRQHQAKPGDIPPRAKLSRATSRFISARGHAVPGIPNRTRHSSPRQSTSFPAKATYRARHYIALRQAELCRTMRLSIPTPSVPVRQPQPSLDRTGQASSIPARRPAKRCRSGPSRATFRAGPGSSHRQAAPDLSRATSRAMPCRTFTRQTPSNRTETPRQASPSRSARCDTSNATSSIDIPSRDKPNLAGATFRAELAKARIMASS